MTDIISIPVRGDRRLADACRKIARLPGRMATRMRDLCRPLDMAQRRAGNVASLTHEISGDTSISPDDILGHSLWQEELPFFMQGRFGKD